MDFQLGIELAITWFDADVIQLQVRGSNGRFTGTAHVYVSHDALPQLASVLHGFPKSVTDTREFELCTFNTNCAGGGARLRFRCIDASGHAVVELRLRTDSRTDGHSEYADFVIPVEAHGIDSFVGQLASQALAIGIVARLQQVV